MKTLLVVLALSIMTTFGSEDGRRPRVVELPTAEIEETLTVEEWMTDDKVWVVDYKIEVEAPLKLEAWMVDENVWE